MIYIDKKFGELGRYFTCLKPKVSSSQCERRSGTLNPCIYHMVLYLHVNQNPDDDGDDDDDDDGV